MPAVKNAPRKGNKPPPMPRSPGFAERYAAVEILNAVLSGDRLLDQALAEEGTTFSKLEPRERGLARAIVGMALRRHGQIRDALKRFLEKPVPRRSGKLAAILDVSAAQILFMDVPDHAAVSLAVDLAMADADARHFKGLANAVLRRLAGEREAILASQDEAALNLPPWLASSFAKAYGEDAARAITLQQLQEPSLDLSVKSDPQGWAEKLGGRVLPSGSVRLIAHGAIEALEGFSAGEWWVQDAAAAMPVLLLGAVEGKRIADLCAAPGGKTLQLAALGAKVTAVDVSEARLRRVRENLARTGLEAELVAADVEAWEPSEKFDAVLLDAPCTATGTIRRHPDIVLTKRPEDVAALAALQARLIAKATSLLKPGGVLVYCTCSLQPQEGEQQVEKALGSLKLAVDPLDEREFPALAPLLRDGFLRTLPSDWPQPDEPRLGGLDGFFAARLRHL